jgi:hypothetical protein
VINYPDHIQPLWQRDRGASTCVRCHGSGAALDLSGTVGRHRPPGQLRPAAARPPLLDASGRVQTRLEEGVPVIVRGPALVDNGASQQALAWRARAGWWRS